MKIWERQSGESDVAFSVFKEYLNMDERNFTKVAEMSRRDVSLIRKWAAKYNWKERAVAWDNSVLEDLRKDIKRRYFSVVKKQWEGNEKIQQKALAAFAAKDLSKASFKSLNEIYHAAFQEQCDIAERIGAGVVEDSAVTIKITKAEKADDSE